VVEPFDEAEQGLNGEDLDEGVVFEVEGDHDAPEPAAHSAVTSATAALAEDSSTMALLAA
jgi:hypothetical protein